LTVRLDHALAAAGEAELRAMAEVGSRLALSLNGLAEPEVGYEALHAVDDQDPIERAVLNAVEVPRS
jgi:hypothetical protein